MLSRLQRGISNAVSSLSPWPSSPGSCPALNQSEGLGLGVYESLLGSLLKPYKQECLEPGGAVEYIAGGVNSLRGAGGAFGDCMTPPPSPALPSQKRIDDNMKAVGLLEAT